MREPLDAAAQLVAGCVGISELGGVYVALRLDSSRHGGLEKDRVPKPRIDLITSSTTRFELPDDGSVQVVPGKFGCVIGFTQFSQNLGNAV